jgi:hypothetical protein
MKRAFAANYLSSIAALIMALIPFHAFLTVSISGLVGHYTLLRLWKEFLLLFLVTGTVYILAKDAALRKSFASSLIVRLIGLYIFLSLALGLAAYVQDNVTLKALGFGVVVNLRFLFFFLSVWIIATKSPLLKQIWPKLLLLPAAVVVVVGILQKLVLPYDFLKHFGYGTSTIYPYETINHNVRYPRVMSTLRGANPLGAYMVLVLAALYALLIKFKQWRLQLSIFAAASILVLVFSYSRAAWIGALISVVLLVLISMGKSQLLKLLLPIFGIVFLACVAGGLFLRHNSTFENIFFHTQTNSTIKTTSDQGHLAAFKSGVHDLVNEPLGRGVGTAGPASFYNNNARISENYYLALLELLL